jgi:hypothetical protein
MNEFESADVRMFFEEMDEKVEDLSKVANSIRNRRAVEGHGNSKCISEGGRLSCEQDLYIPVMRDSNVEKVVNKYKGDRPVLILHKNVFNKMRTNPDAALFADKNAVIQIMSLPSSIHVLPQSTWKKALYRTKGDSEMIHSLQEGWKNLDAHTKAVLEGHLEDSDMHDVIKIN